MNMSVDLKHSVATESNEATSPKEGAGEGADVKSEINNGEEGAADETFEQHESLMQEAQEPVGSKLLLEPYRRIITLRQKDPIYLIKPVAIVEENIKYDYEDLEESLINLLMEKVVVMREVPFMKAIEQLERNTNVKKIYDQISKTTGVGNFAGR